LFLDLRITEEFSLDFNTELGVSWLKIVTALFSFQISGFTLKTVKLSHICIIAFIGGFGEFLVRSPI